VTGHRLPAVLAATAALLLAACGIRADDQPRALPVPPSTTAPAAPATTGGSASAVLWYVDDQRLVPAPRALTDRSLGTALGALLEPGAALEGALSNSIPAGTRLRELQLDEGVLGIDLSGSFQELAGTARQLAIGQLVLTATEDREVEEVRFLVDGEPVLTSSPERGDVTSVTACDFAPLLPSAEEATAAQLSSTTVERLDQRRSELERDCPSS
jgi:hypothetical protein